MHTPEIMTEKTRDLVAGIEENSMSHPEISDALTVDLVSHLMDQCSLVEVQERYDAYRKSSKGELGKYPLASDGYVESFDALTQELDLFEYWRRFGVVAGKQVVAEGVSQNAINRVKDITLNISGEECDLDKPETYAELPRDENDVPILTRGFFEVYHDDSLAQIRQSLRSYLHQVVLWGRADLWTTFDRFGVKLPNHGESIALPLHVDQNPHEHPMFRTIQGVIALSDCPEDRGTLVTVPGSKSLFSKYGEFAELQGEYVELDLENEVAATLQEHAQPMPLRQGDIINWDSRTTHANTANTSNETRFIALAASGIARTDSQRLVTIRNQAFMSGSGSNVRDAYMHASKPPRYSNPEVLSYVRQPEQLTTLGRLLYGQESYAEL